MTVSYRESWRSPSNTVNIAVNSRKNYPGTSQWNSVTAWISEQVRCARKGFASNGASWVTATNGGFEAAKKQSDEGLENTRSRCTCDDMYK